VHAGERQIGHLWLRREGKIGDKRRGNSIIRPDHRQLLRIGFWAWIRKKKAFLRSPALKYGGGAARPDLRLLVRQGMGPDGAFARPARRPGRRQRGGRMRECFGAAWGRSTIASGRTGDREREKQGGSCDRSRGRRTELARLWFQAGPCCSCSVGATRAARGRGARREWRRRGDLESATACIRPIRKRRPARPPERPPIQSLGVEAFLWPPGQTTIARFGGRGGGLARMMMFEGAAPAPPADGVANGVRVGVGNFSAAWRPPPWASRSGGGRF